jgi:MFS-type transporter involved in bile tolerance (Atg22 family)
MDIFQTVYDWFMGLGVEYGVNPIVFGSIYVGAIPFFSLSIGWLVSNYRKGKSIVLPSMSATFFFISAYLYLMVAGQNVPWWVYAVVVGLVVYGAWSTYRKVKSQIKEKEKSNG